jgi:hypothetical protein
MRREQYPIKDGSLVYLTVTIGEAQQGACSAVLSGRTVANGRRIDRAELGAGAALRGKSLVVSAMVAKTRKETDRSSITVSLTGGETPAEWADVEQISNQGDIAHHAMVVDFR